VNFDFRACISEIEKARETCESKLTFLEWKSFWLSSEWGAMAYFPTKYAALKKNNTHTVACKRLWNFLLQKDDGKKLNCWAEAIRIDNPEAPNKVPKFERLD